jgi:hypothetical protein
MKSDLVNVDSLLITYFLPLILIAYIWKIMSREDLIFDKRNNEIKIYLMKFIKDDHFK